MANETGGRGESGFFPALVETARIVNVNINDYTVDAVGEYGNRRFLDIQVMSPYFHYANGEGWYAIPEVGALCWVCTESAGFFPKRFILGYQSPPDTRVAQGESLPSSNFKSNRQNLNPGDMMWRGRDENFVILRRGGVVQVGSGPANQRIHIPFGNLIKDFCFAYDLQTLSGDLGFQNDREDQDDAGQVKTRFRVRVKTTANDKEHAVLLTAGSHADDGDLRLSLQINESGAEGAPTVVKLLMDKEGSATWTLQKNLSISATGTSSLVSGGDMTLKSSGGKVTVSGKGDVAVTSSAGTLALSSKGAASLTGSTMTIEGSTIALKGRTHMGGPGGQSIVRGEQLQAWLRELIDGLTNSAKPAGVSTPPGTPMLFPGLKSLVLKLDSILSKNHTAT